MNSNKLAIAIDKAKRVRQTALVNMPPVRHIECKLDGCEVLVFGKDCREGEV